MAIYYVDVTVEAESSTLELFFDGSTGWNESSASPRQLAPGDQVGFRRLQSSGATIVASGFASTHWTSAANITITSSYQYKTASATIPVSTLDSVSISATRSGFSPDSAIGYYIGLALAPDVTIDTDQDVYEISSTATSHTIVISDIGDSTNSSITEYRVYDSVTTHESRTGPGSLTVTDVPPVEGFPKSYSIEARVTVANGGSGIWNYVNVSYSVLATTTATANSPTIDNYGIAIYDNAGVAVTSFSGGHTALRKLYSNASVTLSTSTYTDVDTGLTGLTSSNCVILIEGASGVTSESSPEFASTFVTGGNGNTHVRIARALAVVTVKVTVAQYKGTTIGQVAGYGFKITNGNNDTVVDEDSIIYGVREVIPLNPSLSTQTLYQASYIYLLYIELVQGRYPGAAGIPIPAISCSKSITLMPPTLLSTKWPDGSYRTVVCYMSKGVTITGNYNLAMLVSSDIATPEYYGGSASAYGLRIYNSSSSVIWDSGWRQAIVNNIIPANQFTDGVNQNGSYDVTTGYDGVTAPLATTAEDEFDLQSVGEIKTVTSLNDMDPANTYVIGPSVSASVNYYMGWISDPESGFTGYGGGGKHLPGIKITSFTSATLDMFRYANGPVPPTTGDRAQRVPTSYHPEGNFILLRIV